MIDAHNTPPAGDPAKRAAEAMQEDLFDSDEFRMYAYKILPCPKRGVHEWSTCPYSHPNEKARRRDPRIYNYLAIPCEATKQGGTCPRGDDCPNCHSLFEYWLHPSRYRTQLCRDMENGHCKRSVCFFAHSIDELRVPDHSHLNIPPEMQAAASGGGASSSRSSSQTSTDVSAVGSSDSSGCSTPRASSSSRGSDGKPPQSGASKAQNIAAARGNSTSSQRPGSRGSRGSTNTSSPTQWASFAGTPAASALLGDTSSSPGGYYNYNAAGMAAAATLEQQRAVLQLQHCQMQAQGLFEQQMHQNLLAAQAGAAAQAQQQQAHQQLMLLQRSQQAAAYLARNNTGGIRGGSPPLSPMPSSSLFERPASFGGDTRNYFVPPSSANAGTLAMASAQAQANWQSAALLCSLSTPAHTGSGSLGSTDLLRQSSGFSGMGVSASPAHNFDSSTGAGMQQLHNSGGSLIDGQADLTLGALLSAASQGLSRSDSQTWGAGTGLSMSAGMPTSAGLPLGCGLQGSGMGDLFSGGTGAGMDATASLLLLQQQQMQQNKAAALGNFLPAFNNGGEVGSEQVLRMMMQQLALQQQSAVM